MLTGRTRFRTQALTGLLVLQVETSAPKITGNVLTSDRTWRDAETQDLSELHSLTYANINVQLPLPPEDDSAHTKH